MSHKQILQRNISFIKPDGQLAEQLKSGKQLRVKFGIDPTGTRMHLGRAATLLKLRQFQDAGHQIVLIIGDFTALVGDASDKTKERPMLSKQEVDRNLENYLAHLGRVLDISKCELRYNSEWLPKLDFNNIAELANQFSVAELLDRENFSNRFKNGVRISLREFLYPLMQGYDSVVVRSDVELGGNDQLFNILAGRTLQKYFGQEPQSVIGTKLINAANGEKMSTSQGNCIWVDDHPTDMFGALMAMRDEEMMIYFEALTDIDLSSAGDIVSSDPRAAKLLLARTITGTFHSQKLAADAEKSWISQFSIGEKPDNIEAFSIKKGTRLCDFLLQNKLVASKSEVNRLIVQGGIRIDGKKVENDISLYSGAEIQIGKRIWVRIR